MDFYLQGNCPMTETVGTLNLKIARLQQRLTVLEQQQKLSRAYPRHFLNLVREGVKVRSQLFHLMLYRDELLEQTTDRMTGRLFDDGTRQSFYPTA